MEHAPLYHSPRKHLSDSLPSRISPFRSLSGRDWSRTNVGHWYWLGRLNDISGMAPVVVSLCLVSSCASLHSGETGSSSGGGWSPSAVEFRGGFRH
ncbi:hypothetical protein DPMN_035177 [Dreissena polymorpha]|uniref:Uncharacterized protein n=1 Tax=Dreissena polymorpha TaxID=45954 RepID=A0A9D4MAF3_DREPO|nr:hypothetical protein DPMN_035177 [Dreissena polymorpha]